LTFDETGLCWTLPSPNMPSPLTALVYTGTCLFEGTNLSEGRGTVKPFEIIGAPWLKPGRVVERLRDLEGVGFGRVNFKPTFSKYAGEVCEGVQLHVLDAERFEPYRTGLRLLQAIRETHVEFAFLPPFTPGGFPFITHLLGHDDILRDNFDAEVFIAANEPAVRAFAEKAREYYLY
jgi:uncharacterized protein YbbC (DUF1343 family)